MAFEIISNDSRELSTEDKYVKEKIGRLYRDREGILYVNPTVKSVNPNFMKYKLIDGVYHFELELKGHEPIKFTGTTSDAWLEVAQNILNKK